MQSTEDTNTRAGLLSMTKEYWETSLPMSFMGEQRSYEQKRKFRYNLQDYMHSAFGFDKFKGQKVLEVGCGSGIDAVEFARNGALVTAIDFSETAVELTRGLAVEAGQSLVVVKAPAGRLPYKDKVFDCVYSFGVLHHIKRVAEALKELQRVLKPNGRVMAMLYHKDSLLYAYSILYLHGVKEGRPILREEDRESLLAQYSERNMGCPYTRAYTKEEARELFEEWFRDVTVDVRYSIVDLSEERKVKLGLDDKYEFGWHLIVKGVKK